MIAKALIRDVIAGTLSALKMYDAVLRRDNRWLILTFHRVLPASLRDTYPLPNLAVTPQELAWVIDTLAPYFTVKTVSDAARCWREQHSFSPMLSITFDDGQWDNVEYALPVLKQKEVAATFYLPTDFISRDELLWHDQAAFAWRALVHGEMPPQTVLSTLSAADQAVLNTSSASSFVKSLKRMQPHRRTALIAQLMTIHKENVDWARMMTWEQARQLLDDGHEVGSHGKSHHLLPQQTPSQQRDELQGSKQALEQHLDLTPLSFCYPNGDYDQQTLSLLTDAGYDNAVTTLWGVNDKSTPAYELYRCDMNPFLMTDRNGHLSRNRLLMRLCGWQKGRGR